MIANKNLSEGSPLLLFLKDETLNLILDDIFQKNQFPQDAIQGEMFQEVLLGFLKIMDPVIKRFGLAPDDF